MYNQMGRRHRGPLVGREDELRTLRQVLKIIEEMSCQESPLLQAPGSDDEPNCPHGIFLDGEAGIGKTRLAEELSHVAQQGGWVVTWSRAYQQEQSIPYRLWIEVLRSLIQQDDGKGCPRYTHVAVQLLQPLTTLLPELADLLSANGISSCAPPAQEPLRLWEAVLALLRAISMPGPLLLVFDDVHWADEKSCELLGYLLRRLAGSRVLVVGTYRQHELRTYPFHPLLDHLQREHLVHIVHLHSLTDEQIGLLVSRLPHRPSELLVQRIQTQAAGNPFFAEELAHSTTALSTSALPTTIAAVLQVRLARLSPACQRLLSKAAVLGGSFELSVIYALETSTSSNSRSGEGHYSTTNETVLELLEEALQSGILIEAGLGTRASYSFWHPLMVSHLYESLSAARRAKIHRHVAEVLRQVSADRQEEQAAIITNHLVKGGANEQDIAHCAELAADRAYRLAAYPDAEKYYKIAVEHIGMVRGRDELLHLSYALERLAESVTIQGKNEDARHCYEQVLEVRSQLPLSVSTDEHLQEAQINALLWGEIGKTWYDVGNTVKAREYYQRGEHVLQKAGLASGFAWARLRFQQSYTYWREGNYEDAYAKAQEARAFFEQANEQQKQKPDWPSPTTATRRVLLGDPVDLGRTYMLLGLTASAAGRCTKALAHLTAALTTYEQYDRQREMAIVYCNIGDLYLRTAEYVLAQDALHHALHIAEKTGEMPLVAVTLTNLGVSATRTGNLPQAQEWLKRGLALAEHMNNPIYMSLLYTWSAHVLQEQGRLAEAALRIHQALTTSRAMRVVPHIGFALLALGSLRVTQAMVTDEANMTDTHEKKRYLLKRARKTVERLLLLEGLEAETRTEGHLMLAQIMLLLGEAEMAQQQASHTLAEAQRYQLNWLIARTHQLMGRILAVLDQQEQASASFELALAMFRTSNMRLEYARTLQYYGHMLLQRHAGEDQEHSIYQQGMMHLHEARGIFLACEAALDLNRINVLLTRLR
ncbi:MAG: AAA family ATPase [Ktedonobacteraceae bacterium]|nr:AAA family ATPase [Ktedonobacteraceae bacterium]